MSSRRAKSSEIGAAVAKGVNMKPTIVAYDGILMIVNAGNLVKSLTKIRWSKFLPAQLPVVAALAGAVESFWSGLPFSIPMVSQLE